MCFKCLYPFILLVAISSIAFSQKWDYPYTNYSKKDGFPTNNIYCVTSDTNGVLWIGTDAGIVRFDGNNIKVLNTTDGLPSNDVFEIFCDSKNRLWITTFKDDITYILNEKIHTKKNDSLLKNINNKNGLPRIFEDSERSLWIRTNPFKLYKISPNNKIQVIDFNIRKGDYYNISQHNKCLYLISFFHTIAFDLETNKMRKIESTKTIKIDGLNVYQDKIYYINQNNDLSLADTSFLSKGYFTSQSLNWKIPVVDSFMWVSSKNGYKVYNLNNIKNFQQFLPNYPVSYFHQDINKNLWVATHTHGLFKLNSKIIYNAANATTDDACTFTSVLTDRNFIYTGTNTGELKLYNRNSLKIIYNASINLNSLTSYRVLKIVLKGNRLFMATDIGLFYHYLGSKNITRIPMDNAAIKNCYISNDSLIVLYNIGVYYWNIKNNLPVDSNKNYKRYYSYIEYKGKKVVGSQDSLYYIDKVFKPYPLNIPFNYRPIDLAVKDSLLIATTAEKGVFFIHDSIVVKNINNSNGLSSNTCYKSTIYRDALYTATNKGINIYHFKTDSIDHIFESDGLPSNTVYDLSIYNDTIYAATEAGLSVIPITAIQKNKTFPLFVKPLIHNTDTLWEVPQLIRLYQNDNLQLVLNSLSFGSKTAINYYYKINSVDSQFNSTLDQLITLKFPAPGQYAFDAYAQNGEGTLSNRVTLHFEILPYFYQTKLFKIILFVFCTLLVFLIYKLINYYTKLKEKKRIEMETRVRSLELNAWKSAINPHFLFNSLNTMQGLFTNQDFESANTYVTEFSGMLRKTIDQSGKLLITIEEEVNYLKNYLGFEKIKRNNKLNFNIQSQLQQTYYIPSLLIQPVVENSLKHGIRDSEIGIIEITFEKKDETIICRIADNGPGFKSDTDHLKKYSKGIKLIQAKIDIVEKLIKKKIIFQFNNRLNSQQEIIGTETIFTFPLIIFDYENHSHNH